MPIVTVEREGKGSCQLYGQEKRRCTYRDKEKKKGFVVGVERKRLFESEGESAEGGGTAYRKGTASFSIGERSIAEDARERKKQELGEDLQAGVKKGLQDASKGEVGTSYPVLGKGLYTSSQKEKGRDP